MEGKSEIPELPTEIIFFHILPRLPTKLVVRCRCVCKSWSSLTRNPCFLAVHRGFRCSPSTHILFSLSDEITSRPTTTPLQHFYSVKLNQEEGHDEKNIMNPATHIFSLERPSYSKLFGSYSINGSTILAHRYNKNRVHVFNPCTQEIITLPDTSNDPCQDDEEYLEFGFKQYLGFSAVTNEYKVLQVQHWTRDDDDHTICLRFRIFTSGTTSWRHLELDFPFDPHQSLFKSFTEKSVCLHGGIHWMDKNRKVVVVFDVGAERFRANIPLPGDLHSGVILEVGGCVAVYESIIMVSQNFMLLWILEDYENHVWVKKTVILPSSWQKLSCPSLFGTIHTGELLLEPTRYDCVYLYDIERNSFRKFKISLPVKTGRWDFVTSYEESVISLRP